MGVVYEVEDRERGGRVALKTLRSVQDGDAGAACLLGEMTLKGRGGIAASQDKAAKLFQLAQSRNTICFTAGQCAGPPVTKQQVTAPIVATSPQLQTHF